MSNSTKLLVGLDVGSVNAKLVVLTQAALPGLFNTNINQSPISHISTVGSFNLYAFDIAKVLGDPFRVSSFLLSRLFKNLPVHAKVYLAATGSQSKRIAELLEIQSINEFKAIARGVVSVEAQTKTILEIGGDGSRFIKVDFDAESDDLSIVDYERNGECAAGTGSFIDQQAARLNYEIEDIGPLVTEAKQGANIAGRCSVFAKSDMIHAQQRGYSPAAIFKGLCEAVVRNYKGTVLKGKTLQDKVVFVGGVAANSGVVRAMRDVFGLSENQLVVPELYAYVGAIGAALQNSGEEFIASRVGLLSKQKHSKAQAKVSSKSLSLENVNFPDEKNKFALPIEQNQIDVYLGLDVGSVSTNLILIDGNGDVIDEIYTRTEGRPVEVVSREFDRWQEKWAHRINVLAVGTTGSGRELIGELVGADSIHDEITAHKTGASFIAESKFNKNVDTIFEIGGQDSKFISIDNGVVVDFAMNEACAAGTGSFLEEQATKLGISIKGNFAQLALASKNPIKMGERCTVFMEKDVTAYMQQGIKKEDITAGLASAVVHNYLNRVVRGRHIGDVIFFQGGTAYNKSVAAAFSTILGKKIIVPPHNGVIGALGVALLAKDKFESLGKSTRFRGFDLSKVKFKIRHINCKACSNNCDVQEITVDGEKTYWGDKCSEQFRKKRQVERKPVIPNLVNIYLDRLHSSIPSPNGLGIKIGFPRTMYHFDRFPFWSTYFGVLGTELVLSDNTNKTIVSEGRELCLSEPCFPIVASHGHYKNVFSKDVDYIFIPNVINSETDDVERESWFCPWGQTLPLVLKNTIDDPTKDKILAPNIRFRDGFASLEKNLKSVAKQLGVSSQKSKKALQLAYQVQEKFTKEIQQIGRDVLQTIKNQNQNAVVIVGRPYNIYDPGLNLNVPTKLWEDYGINVIPMDFLPLENISIRDVHDNMFWGYGRRILQAAKFVGQTNNLHIIYFTNFKCGPDSYIKHFVRKAVNSASLILQFDDHSNDAGIMTRCEAYLESKDLLRTLSKPVTEMVEG